MIVIAEPDIDLLLQALRQRGYKLVGPAVRDRVIVYDTLEHAADLPIGWTDRQEGGTYRLEKRKDNAYFGYVMGPQSWKKFLFPGEQTLWSARRDGNQFHIVPEEPQAPAYAFIGVRPCEMAAIQIQDKIFTQGDFADPHYQTRREKAFILAVNCTQPGEVCFCTSQNTGPEVKENFDIALTEVIDKKQHYFLAQSGSKTGSEILAKIPSRTASPEEVDAGTKALEQAKHQMGRSLQNEGLAELLKENMEHPEWEKVADRCLTCGNCTLVCPTCFCHTVEDVTDLAGETAKRVRRWDSCFTIAFTYIHGGSVRQSAMSRYRQWMTHKLSYWQDQFGVSGCVGCGRCITWCPVGIDITEEARIIRESKHREVKR